MSNRRRHGQFDSRHLQWLRGQAERAITRLNLDATGRLLHYIASVADLDGATWIGAVALGEGMHRSERRTRELLRLACAAGHLQRIVKGGGRRKTSAYLLKVGNWRFRESAAHAYAKFAERVRKVRARYFNWLGEKSTAQVEIEWHLVE
jgi:hypothetical protein